LPGNLPRAVPDSLGVEVDSAKWTPPEIFSTLSRLGIGQEDMFSTFNMGIGFCLIVEPDDVEQMIESLSRHGAAVIGQVTDSTGFTLK
jgi:phosphoribosylformylglycinamidine cyclo-ligase